MDTESTKATRHKLPFAVEPASPVPTSQRPSERNKMMQTHRDSIMIRKRLADDEDKAMFEQEFGKIAKAKVVPIGKPKQ